jgi:diadenosine tetraphosphatase ApaH/serine/threonine PP2A family protein phosphatase
MRYAILSDVHGRREKLASVLDDARARGAAQIISLGDVGDDGCMDLLRQADALAVFGNYEVSGWPRLQPEHQAWVRSWLPLLAGDGFLAVHAAPWRPEGLHTVEDFGAWLDATGRSWRDLFPYLTDDEDYLWQALAELEEMEKAVLFHGHTHQQAVWQWGPTGRLRRLRASSLQIKTGHRYVVGVGSVGQPEDGGHAAYTIYDSSTGQIELVRLR